MHFEFPSENVVKRSDMSWNKMRGVVCIQLKRKDGKRQMTKERLKLTHIGKSQGWKMWTGSCDDEAQLS
jgi:hypothetical protein